MGSNRALGTDTRARGGGVNGVTRSVESVVDAQFSGTTLTKMLDCSPELALRSGDQLECAEKAKQDRQQRSHLQPVKQKANRLETHFLTPVFLGSSEGHGPSGRVGWPRNRRGPRASANPAIARKISLAWSVIKCPSTRRPASVNDNRAWPEPRG